MYRHLVYLLLNRMVFPRGGYNANFEIRFLLRIHNSRTWNSGIKHKERNIGYNQLHGPVSFFQELIVRSACQIIYLLRTRIFIAVFIRAHQWPLFWAIWIQFIPSNFFPPKSYCKLSSRLRFGLLSDLFTSGFPAKFLYALFMYPMRATSCPKHSPWLRLHNINLITQFFPPSFTQVSRIYNLIHSESIGNSFVVWALRDPEAMFPVWDWMSMCVWQRASELLTVPAPAVDSFGAMSRVEVLGVVVGRLVVWFQDNCRCWVDNCESSQLTRGPLDFRGCWVVTTAVDWCISRMFWSTPHPPCGEHGLCRWDVDAPLSLAWSPGFIGGKPSLI